MQALLGLLDGLFGCDLRDRLFQHTICLFPGLRLKSSNSTALSALDVVPQAKASFVLCADRGLVLACSSRFVPCQRRSNFRQNGRSKIPQFVGAVIGRCLDQASSLERLRRLTGGSGGGLALGRERMCSGSSWACSRNR